MMKRVFIIHGWGGHPEEGAFPWAKQELTKLGYKVEVPAMPNTDNPKIDEWVSKLKLIIGYPTKDTYLIGHSIGCQAILRYLATLTDKKIGGAILIAPWFNLTGIETKEEEKIAKPWLETPINFQKVLLATRNITAIFSDNDPFVPLSEVELFKSRLGAKTIIEKNKGHFSGSDGTTELPLVLSELKRFANNA